MVFTLLKSMMTSWMLAQTRAEEVSVKYSHERPDGTRVVKEYGYGENVGAKSKAPKNRYHPG